MTTRAYMVYERERDRESLNGINDNNTICTPECRTSQPSAATVQPTRLSQPSQKLFSRTVPSIVNQVKKDFLFQNFKLKILKGTFLIKKPMLLFINFITFQDTIRQMPVITITLITLISEVFQGVQLLGNLYFVNIIPKLVSTCNMWSLFGLNKVYNV